MNKSFKFVTKNDRNLALKYFKNDPISILPVVDKNMQIIDIITLKKILNRNIQVLFTQFSYANSDTELDQKNLAIILFLKSTMFWFHLENKCPAH